jgi:hypothetical protein
MGTEESMGKAPVSSVGSDDVLQVDSKWSYLPITRGGHNKSTVLDKFSVDSRRLSAICRPCLDSVMPYCWYLYGGDFASSGMITHSCWGEYLSPCGKAPAILSHLSGLTWVRNFGLAVHIVILVHFCPHELFVVRYSGHVFDRHFVLAGGRIRSISVCPICVLGVPLW